MALLPPAELNQIIRDVQEIIRDITVNVDIKYRQYTGNDFYNPQDQYYNSPYTDTSGVSAIRGLITRNEVDRIGGGVQIGDAKFVIMQSGVSNVLSTSDLIVESGVTYNIIKITLDSLGIVYQVFGRKG